LNYCCPLCKGILEERPDSYHCVRDQRSYRIIFGIPDFRIFPDPYISFDAEDAKATRIAAECSKRTFEELVAFYYSITPEVPPDLVQKYTRYVHSGVVRARSAFAEIERQMPLASHNAVLDIGCATGGFLVTAAQMFDRVVGLDIALRWLVIAKKRLEESGISATLVCACAEYLPFLDNSFQLVVASEVIEHTSAQAELVREARRVLAPNGVLFLATPNRWCPMPDPHVQVWGVGFLPKSWREPYVRLVRKIPYKNISTLNYFDIRRLLRQTGFAHWQIILPEFNPSHAAHLSTGERALVPIYHAVKELPFVRLLLYLFAPIFHVLCVKTVDAR
jgi:ubiquinone/menaquinone biosynthesis C-methylase UbiE/uncharacterized protein YbaR (Trm112 family)